MYTKNIPDSRNNSFGLKLLFSIYIMSFPYSLLPFLKPVQNFFGLGAALSNTFFIFLISLVVFLLLRSSRKSLPPLISQTLGGVLILCVSSFLMALILTPSLRSLWGETPLDCIVPRMIFYLLVPIVFLYNFYGFNCVTKEDLVNLFFAYSTVLLVFAYVQIFIIWGLPLAGLYDKIDVLNILTSSSEVLKGRVMSVTDEPSYLASDVGTTVLPFLFACNIMGIRKRLSLTHIALYLPVVFYAGSSALFIVVVAVLFMWIYFKLSGRKERFLTGERLLLVLFAALLLVVVVLCLLLVPEISDAFKKITDTSSMSTAYRYSTVVNDILVFLKYPILGCGNGIQGFFYNENCPDWAYFSYETQNSLNGVNGVLNGGAFVPAHLSGFGILGIVLLGIFLKTCISLASSNQKRLGFLYYMYLMGLVAFLVNGTVNVSIDGSFHEMFILSLPLCVYSEKLMNSSVDESTTKETHRTKSKFLKVGGKFA